MKHEQPIGESYAAAGLCKSISALAKEEATLLQTAVALPPALQARAGLHPHRRECEEQLTSYVFNSIPHSPEHQPSSLLPASSGHKADNLNFLPPLAGGQFDQQPNGFQLHPVASPTHKGSEQLDHEHNSDSEDEGAKPKRPAGTQQCPRCNSNNTKFCYYNNYNVKQPRYYCRDCQRYWTMGGSLRQIAPGAGRRKPKAEKCKVKAADQHDNHPTAVEVAATAAPQQLTPSEQETALYQLTNVAAAATVSGGLQQQQILNQAVDPAKELMVPLGVVQSAALTAQPEALAAVAAAAAASLPALAQHMALTGALQANSLDLNLLAGTPAAAAAAAGADAMLQQQQQGQGSDMFVGQLKQLLYPAGTDPATATANAAAALGGIHPLLAAGLMPGLAGLLPAAAGALPGPTEMPTAWQTAALASAAAAASGMDPLTSLTAIVAAIAAAGQQQQQGQQSQIGAAMAALTAAGLMPRGLDLTAAAAAAVQGGPAAAAAAALGLLNPPSYEQQQQQVAAMAGLQGMLLGAPQLPNYQQQQQQQLQQQQQQLQQQQQQQLQQQQQQLRQQHKQAQQQLELQQLLQGYSHVNMPLGQQQPAAAMQMAEAPSLAAAATAHHTPSAAAADADGAGDRSDALERRVKPRLQQPVESSPQDQAAAKQQQQSSPGVQEVAVTHAVQPEEATTGAGLQQSPGFQIQTSPAAADLIQQQQSQQQQQRRRVGTMGPPPPHKPQQQQQQQATLHHQQQSLLPTNTPDLAQQLQQQGVLQQLQSAFGGAAGADWGRIAQQGVLNPAILAAAAASGSQVTSPTAAVAAAAEKQLAAAAVAANSQLTADQNGVTQLAAALQVQAAAMQLAHAHAQVNASAAAQALQAAIAASGMPLQAALGSLNPAAAGGGDVTGCWDALNSSLSLGHLLQQQQMQANQQQQLAVSQQQQQQQLAAGQMDALGVAAAAAALGNGNAWQQQQATGDAAAALVVARYMEQQMAAAAAPAYAGMG